MQYYSVILVILVLQHACLQRCHKTPQDATRRHKTTQNATRRYKTRMKLARTEARASVEDEEALAAATLQTHQVAVVVRGALTAATGTHCARESSVVLVLSVVVVVVVVVVVLVEF